MTIFVNDGSPKLRNGRIENHFFEVSSKSTMIKEEPMDMVEEPILVKSEPLDETPTEDMPPPVAEAARNAQMHRYCNVYGCLVNSLMYPSTAFYRLPEDTNRRTLWLTNINRVDLINRTHVNIYICEKHFQEVDIVVAGNTKLLKTSAIPRLDVRNYSVTPDNTKELSLDQAVQVKPSVFDSFVQTDIGHQVNATAQVNFESFDDLKAEIGTELYNAKKKLKTIEHGTEKTRKDRFDSACDRVLSPQLAAFVKEQTDLTYNCRNNRYSLAYKIFSLNLFFVSPKLYRMVEKDFRLPNINRLKNYDVQALTDHSDEMLRLLRVKVQHMTEREKYCVVALGIMRLRAHLSYNAASGRIVGFHDIDGEQKPLPAKYVAVVAVRGLFIKWMQPVEFALLSEHATTPRDVSNWVDKVLAKLLEIGLKIKAYIPDQDWHLLDEVNIRKITFDKPHFFLKDVKIHFLYNVPDLLIKLRNCFLFNNFNFQKSDGNMGTAEFEHVRMFYKIDKDKELKMAPKLTKLHLRVHKLNRKSLHYAAEVLSKTVATGVATYVEFNEIDESAQDTVELLLIINNLFDLLNSSQNHNTSAYTGNHAQKELLEKSLRLFESLNLSHSKTGKNLGRLDFIRGFQITISAISNLFVELQEKGYDHFFTQRLNLDAMDNFFKKIRVSKAASSYRFVKCFRKLYFSAMLKPAEGGNCSKELITILLTQNQLTENCDWDEASTSVATESNEFAEIKTAIAQLSEQEVAKTSYVGDICKILLITCVKAHDKCKLLQNFAETYSTANFMSDPAVSNFVNVVWFMENQFQNIFPTMLASVGTAAFDQLKETEFTYPCPCFPTQLLQKTFLRLRIHMTIKYNNLMYRKNRETGFVLTNLTAQPHTSR